MLIRTLNFGQASIIAAVVCSLIVAGLLKGTIGVGMPIVALPLLSLFIDVKSAAMLLSMPLIFSNMPQALEGGKTGRCLVQLTPVILGMIPGLFLGVRVLLALDANVAKIIAGLVLMGVGGVTLLAPKLQLQSRLVLLTGVTFGFFGGILGGLAAMAGPLVFIFLLAKGLRGKAFTKEASLYLVVSAGLLAIFLTASSQFSWLDVSVSTAATLPVVLGMYVGQQMRDRIAPETFRKLVLIAVIAAGAELLRAFADANTFIARMLHHRGLGRYRCDVRYAGEDLRSLAAAYPGTQVWDQLRAVVMSRLKIAGWPRDVVGRRWKRKERRP
jgi:uncharacterized membrane protein YfcA